VFFEDRIRLRLCDALRNGLGWNNFKMGIGIFFRRLNFKVRVRLLTRISMCGHDHGWPPGTRLHPKTHSRKLRQTHYAFFEAGEPTMWRSVEQTPRLWLSLAPSDTNYGVKSRSFNPLGLATRQSPTLGLFYTYMATVWSSNADFAEAYAEVWPEIR